MITNAPSPPTSASPPRFYEAKGIRLLRGAAAAGFTAGADGRVRRAGEEMSQPPTAQPPPTSTNHQPLNHPLFSQVASVQLKDGSSLDASLVVVGVGARPNAELFEGQLKVGYY
jgi:hypothetical protein